MTFDEAKNSDQIREAFRLWETSGRCPAWLGAALRNYGLPGHAAGAEWAAAEPDRGTLIKGGKPDDQLGGINPLPFQGGWVWEHDDNPAMLVRCKLPSDVFAKLLDSIENHYAWLKYPTHAAAVSSFLEAWAALHSTD